MTVNQQLEKAKEIASLGCPFCGNPGYTTIINDKEGIFFACTDDSCPSKGRRIPLKEAMDNALTKNVAEKKKRLFCVNKEIKKLEEKTFSAECQIYNFKCGELKAYGDSVLRLKAAYKSVNTIKIWGKRHERVVTEKCPIVVRNPVSNEVFEVYSSNSRRRVKRMILVEYELAKRELAKAIEQFSEVRSELSAMRESLRNLRRERNDIQSALKGSDK